MVRTFKPVFAVRRSVDRDTRKRDMSYADRRWRAMSAAFVQQYPFCVLCLCCGFHNDGVARNAIERQRNLIVDHIAPHRGNPDLFWDFENLQTLCRMPCHDRIKQSHEKGNGSADAWYAYLRERMATHNTRTHVNEFERWIPTHILEHLV